MRKLTNQTTSLMAAMIGSAVLSACGGGSGGAPAQTPSVLSSGVSAPTSSTGVSSTGEGSTVVVPPANTITPPPTEPTPQPPVVEDPIPENVVTNIRFENTSATTQAQVPVTFGQAFAVGHVGPSQTVIGKLPDGTVVPLQVDVKARHTDGSVRHAIVSAKLTNLVAGQPQLLSMEKSPAGAAAAATTPAALLEAGFTTKFNATVGGQLYTASADELLRTGPYKTWLSGPVANEWLVSAPLKDANNNPHPHLTARFAIRAFGVSRVRVDVTIENNWAYVAAPQNFTYDAQVLVGGQTVFTKAGLNHYHHARWRKVFWWGGEPAVHARHNVPYLLKTRALPNFDRSVTFTETKLASWKTAWTGTKTEPMGVGLANPYMPSTGGRDDIGLLPAWGATYLLSMDKRARDVTMGTADLAGSWSIHYRDQNTDRPVSLADYPYMTLLGQRTDTVNPATKKQEAFPLCATTTACTSPYSPDASHQPAFAYLPYLVSGDHYYLEELQFWAAYVSFMSNPHYREFGKGLVKPDQVRGQAWSLRTIGEAAYISPDTDPLKQQFASIVNHNLDWYNTNYTNNATTNPFGVLTHGYAMGYNNGTGMAPWMDDFFTSAIGHLAEMGFEKASPLLLWKAKFPIMRMTDPEACWITGAIYSLNIRASATGPFFTSMGQAHLASNPTTLTSVGCASTAMASALSLKVGEMTGYSGMVTGYPSNMQPALAYAADVGGSAGAAAWSVFAARTVKPNYGLGPQFAIVPR